MEFFLLEALRPIVATVVEGAREHASIHIFFKNEALTHLQTQLVYHELSQTSKTFQANDLGQAVRPHQPGTCGLVQNLCLIEPLTTTCGCQPNGNQM